MGIRIFATIFFLGTSIANAVDNGWVSSSTQSFTVNEMSANSIAIGNCGGENCGLLMWGSGKLEFNGNLDESAKAFFEYLKPYVDQYMEDYCERKNEIYKSKKVK